MEIRRRTLKKNPHLKNIMDDFQIESTPNPNALKFILKKNVIDQGKATFHLGDDCNGNILARDLLAIKDIVQVHFFENVISITRSDAPNFSDRWKDLSGEIESVLMTRLPTHNPHFNEQKIQYEKKRKKNLSPDIQKIENILDQTVRSGLQADGGDIEVIDYKDNKLYIRYEGACGSCPSAVTGTLYAIESILQQDFPHIQVIPI